MAKRVSDRSPVGGVELGTCVRYLGGSSNHIPVSLMLAGIISEEDSKVTELEVAETDCQGEGEGEGKRNCRVYALSTTHSFPNLYP